MCKSIPFPRSLSASARGEFFASAAAPPLSRNQALVMGVLRAATGRALTAYEVLERLRPEGIRGPQTVYRALDALREAGLIHRIESLNAYTSAVSARPSCGCTPAPYDDHAHPSAFAVCRGCGAVNDLEDAALAAVLGVAADGSGYAVERSVVELVGTCPDCTRAAVEA
ncbi:Fur family transcriptional regulator [Roseococcus microcysteis]|uniref:Fur family transcriptional regulator n=1 Tax=Roseococcus microcysteis TaxID=2771361 RepID=UPI00168BA49C|nr:Fur family transcriptional regulator [Roseococcus microcysteis]